MKKLLTILGILSVTLLISACVNSISFESPTPDDTPTLGNQYSSVTVTEYANFACPACANFSVVIDELMKEMGDQIRFVFAHYPFDLHGVTEADLVKFHNAAECADDKGKFKAFHDIVYQNQSKEDFGIDKMFEYGEEAGLNDDEFKACVENLAHEDTVRNSKKRGTQFGVTSTPTFFINDRMFNFDRGPDAADAVTQLKNAIEAAMAEASNLSNS